MRQLWIGIGLLTAALALAFPASVSAQAMVEAGLGAGRAAVTGAGARSAGGAISGAWAAVDQAIKPGAQPQSTSASSSVSRVTATVTPLSKATAARAAGPPPEDPAKIRAGLSYDELLRRFGPPSTEANGGEVRTLQYGAIQVDVENGTVSTVTKVKSETASVTLPK
ncbi:MAG TPA: hypothetical protein VGF59_07755 [Bryobacteraceae bacterium]